MKLIMLLALLSGCRGTMSVADMQNRCGQLGGTWIDGECWILPPDTAGGGEDE